MARKNQTEEKHQPGVTVMAMDISLRTEDVDRIVASVEGEESPSVKVGRVAMGCLENLASGGMMLSELQVRQVSEAAGKEIDAQELTDFAETGAGRKGGLLSISLNIDPAYRDLLQPVADFQQVTIEQVLQNALDTAWDNGWLYADAPTNMLDRIVLTKKDRARIEMLIGRKFTSGQDMVEGLGKAFGDDTFGSLDDIQEEPAPTDAPKVVRSMTAAEWEGLPEAEKRARLAMNTRQWDELPEPTKRDLIAREAQLLELQSQMKGKVA